MGHLLTQYQQYIHLSRYSRWNYDIKRRETWPETVARYFDFFQSHLKDNYNFDLTKHRKYLEDAVLSLKVMPSMRCLMTAGPALKRDNIAGYNCSYAAVNRVQSFDEILYILLCGTGVGFSVESHHISKLPTVAEEFHDSDIVIHVADSKLGWAKAYKELISLLYQGQIPKYDMSQVRPAGSVLKTFGGRASGPEPLVELFQFAIHTFKNAAGRKLNTVECHDLVCKSGDAVVVGGVRRAALISLSDLNDDRMQKAKSGKWWETHPWRELANNSAVYSEKPDIGTFMSEWLSLYQSKSGERGIFNRLSAQKVVEQTGRRDSKHEFGVNPCSEIILRDREFCNLSEAVIRETDDFDIVAEKVKIAAILGTMQASLTDFKYVSKKWKENCIEEALLGVSLTGVMDSDLFNNKIEGLDDRLYRLKEIAVKTNIEWAKNIGINPAKAVTCNKPSGTVSALVDSASGIHPRHSKFYIRTVRGDKKDPMSKLMRDKGFPVEDCVSKPKDIDIFLFPMKTPNTAICRKDITAIDHLELWLKYQDNWCEHKPSITVSVKEDEWLQVGAWVYKNFDKMSGVSFLPYSEHIYKQAPYQDCTEEQYKELLSKMPIEIDWSELSDYENHDMTVGAQTLACAAGVCEI